MDITVKKIKVGKGKLVFEYDKKEDEESLISTHTSKFKEEPEPEFWRIFGLLSVDVCKILEVDPGQLAEEMRHGAWVRTTPREEEIFGADAGDLWRKVLRRLGGQAALLSAYTATPELN